MVVRGFICKGCKTFTYSRTRHDFAACACEPASFMDGGQDNEYGGGYMRAGGDPEKMLWGGMEVNTTPRALYDDWNYNENAYGQTDVTDEEIKLWEGKESDARPMLRTGACNIDADQKT